MDKPTHRLGYDRSIIRVERCDGEAHSNPFIDNCGGCMGCGWGLIAWDTRDPARRKVKVELGRGVRIERFTDEELQPGAVDLARAWADPAARDLVPAQFALALVARVQQTTYEKAKTSVQDVAIAGECIGAVMRAGPRHQYDAPESIALRALRAAGAALGAM